MQGVTRFMIVVRRWGPLLALLAALALVSGGSRWTGGLASWLEIRIDIAQLTSSDPWAVERARRTLRRAGPTAMPALTRALQGHDSRLRSEALNLLSDLPPADRPGLPQLRVLLADPDPGRHRAAVHLLLPSPRERGAYVRAIGVVLVNGGPAARAVLVRDAAWSLYFNRHYRAALGLLRRGLRDPSPEPRLAALEVIADPALQRFAVHLIPDLVRTLDEPDRRARLAALKILPWLGSEAAAARPRIALLARSHDAEERLAALEAGAHIGWSRDDADELILAGLGSASKEARCQAALDLGSPSTRTVSRVESSEPTLRSSVSAMISRRRCSP